MRQACTVCAAPSNGPRCPAHVIPKITRREQAKHRRLVAAHVANVGRICPGWGRPPHEATDLTADHVIPRALGGGNGPLQVLCRSCNARKGDRESGYAS